MIRIRSAIEADVPLVLALIRELAEYEKLSHEVAVTQDDLRRALFGLRPAAEALIAELEPERAGKMAPDPAGFALFFQSFSTFLGKPGLYLEDLFVRPAMRRHGVGRALFAHLARLAVERGYGRFDWSVLDWNEPAIAFYRRMGAIPLSDWTVFRLTGDSLRGAGKGPG